MTSIEVIDLSDEEGSGTEGSAADNPEVQNRHRHFLNYRNNSWPVLPKTEPEVEEGQQSPRRRFSFRSVGREGEEEEVDIEIVEESFNIAGESPVYESASYPNPEGNSGYRINIIEPRRLKSPSPPQLTSPELLSSPMPACSSRLIMPELRAFFPEGGMDNPTSRGRSRKRTIKAMEAVESFTAEAETSNEYTPKQRKKYEKTRQKTPEQLNELLAAFKNNPYARGLHLLDLQKSTRLDKKSISNWFRTQRMQMFGTEKMNKSPGANNGKDEESEITRTPRRKSFTETAPRSADFQGPSVKRNIFLSPATATSDTETVERVSAPTTTLFETRSEMIQRRMSSIQSYEFNRIQEVMENTSDRLQKLIILFACDYGLTTRISVETRRLREMSVKSPFSLKQKKFMEDWCRQFFKGFQNSRKNARGKERKIRTLTFSFVRSQLLAVWHPVIVYGKLCDLSLINAIRHFTFKSDGRAVADNLEYHVPIYLKSKDFMYTNTT